MAANGPLKPIIEAAHGIARLQDLLECFRDPAERKQWIMDCWDDGVITDDEAELLIEHNDLESA